MTNEEYAIVKREIIKALVPLIQKYNIDPPDTVAALLQLTLTIVMTQNNCSAQEGARKIQAMIGFYDKPDEPAKQDTEGGFAA